MKKISFFAAAGFAALVSAAPVMAEDWHESPWGPDDQLGSANRMTAQSILEAASLVTEGKMYSLGIVVDNTTPAFGDRFLRLHVTQPGQTDNSGLGENAFTYNDDFFTGWLGIGPQIDGLGHSGIDHVYYRGLELNAFATPSGLTELGLENLPGIVARGVVLDMAGYFGVGMVPEGTPYNEEEIRGAAERQGVELREGDVVIFHSNWLELLDGENPDLARFGSVEPGLGVGGAEYLAELGVIAVGSDTWGMEVVPAEEEGQAFRVHQIIQAENGIYILENMETRELGADEAWEFMFVLGQVRLRGAVQMMVNPIAIR